MSAGYGYGYYGSYQAQPGAGASGGQNGNANVTAAAYGANPNAATNGAYAQYYHQRQQAYQQRLAAYYDEQRRTADFQARMQQTYKQVHPVPPNLHAQTAPQARTYANVVAAPSTAQAYPSAPYAQSYAAPAAPAPRAAPQQPQPPASKPTKPTGFPDSLQAYVQSALKQCINDKEKKKAVEDMLKVIVEKAISSNTMWTTDWTAQPPPAELYKKLTGTTLSPNIASESITKGKSESSKPSSGAGYASEVASGSNASYSNSANTATAGATQQAAAVQPRYTHPSYASQGQPSYQASHSGVHPSYAASQPNLPHNSAERAYTQKPTDSYAAQRDYRAAEYEREEKQSPYEAGKRKKSQKKASKAKKAKHEPIKVKEKSTKASSKMSDGFKVNKEEKSKRSQRQERFNKSNASKTMDTTARWNPYQAQIDAARIKNALRTAEQVGESLDLSKFAIKGTCQDLEKRYLRLTSAPDPSTVRPENVLINALKWVKKRWRKRKKYSSQADMEAKTPYMWASEQLKSIRQDLTVQHIQNSFTVNVYETHAKLALEQEDLTEFNQCQTKLVELYKRNLGDVERKNEFAAYRIFYQTYIRFKYSSPSSEMTSLLGSLTPAQRQSKVVKHALKVRSAVEDGNYAAFFYLYETVENMGVFLLDLLIDYVRHTALQIICKAYRPTIPLKKLQQQLLLEPGSKEWNDMFIHPKIKFVNKDGKPVSTFKPSEADKVDLDTKSSYAHFNTSFKWRVLKGDNVQRSEA